MKRLATLFLFSSLLVACPGSLEDPDRFMRQGMPICTLGIDVETDLFATSCSGASCHGDGTNPGSGGVDLVKAGVAERLLDKPAAGCMQRPLVDTASIGASVLLLRVTGQSECGAAMPLGTSGLSPAQLQCIEAWIMEKIMSSTTAGAM